MPDSTVNLPVVFMALPAVAEAVPDMEKSSIMLNAVPGMVLVPLPLRIRQQ